MSKYLMTLLLLALSTAAQPQSLFDVLVNEIDKAAQQSSSEKKKKKVAADATEPGGVIQQFNCADPEIQRRAAVILRQEFTDQIVADLYGRAPTADEREGFKTDVTFNSINSAKTSASGETQNCNATAVFNLRNGSAAESLLSRDMMRADAHRAMEQIEGPQVVNYRAIRASETADVLVEAKIGGGFEPAGLQVAQSPLRQELQSGFTQLKVKGIQMFGAEPPPPRLCMEAADAWEKTLFKDPAQAIDSSALNEMVEQLSVVINNLHVDWICLDDLGSSYAGGQSFGAMSAISKQYGVVGVTVFAEWKALDYAFEELNRAIAATAGPPSQRPLSLQAIKQRYEAGEYDEWNPDPTFKTLDAMTGVINERLGFIQQTCGNACAHTTQASTLSKRTSQGGETKVRVRLSKPKFHPWYITTSDRDLITKVQVLRTRDFGTLTLCVASLAGVTGCSADGVAERAAIEGKRKEFLNASNQQQRAVDM